jgi:uroporphyrinogen decarboxylase
VNSRERLLAALDHREPDRLPFDLGSTQVTGIHTLAYRNLRAYLGLPAVEIQLCDHIQQLALPDQDVIEKLGVDIRGLFPLSSHNWRVENLDAGNAWEYRDEWGITHRLPKPDGLYYSAIRHPLSEMRLNPEIVRDYPWPDTGDLTRITRLRQQALDYRVQGQAVVIKGVLAGIFEMSQRLRGMKNCLIDMAGGETGIEALFDQLLALKLAFWEMALPRLADTVDVIAEGDDYGSQTSLLISPVMFRKLLKPRLKVLFEHIKQMAPQVRIFFHSCGSVRPLIPDFIELGVDILNPVQIGAAGMEAVALKRDFGRELVFWGGGVDCQTVLPYGTPEQVKDDVRRNIEALASGGGFVFNSVHNIQPDVPPENILAMWEAMCEV